MKNVSVNLKIDRHRFSGNARIFGRVGEQSMDVNVLKGPQSGDAYIKGETNGRPTTLRINSGIVDSGHAVFGRLAGTGVKGHWAQSPEDGDVSFQLNKANLAIDNMPEADSSESRGTALTVESQILNSEGDETATLRIEGERVRMNIDRKSSGDIEVRGSHGGGPFRLKMKSRGQDRDLQLTGTMPDGLSLMPLMWELYGDDSLKPAEQPLSLGTAAGLGAFWSTQIS